MQNGQNSCGKNAFQPLRNFCCMGIIARSVAAGVRSSPQPAQSNHVAARCCFPPARSMIRGCQSRESGELPVRKDAAPGDKVSTAALKGVCNPVRVLSHNSRTVRFGGQGSLLVRNIPLKDPNRPSRTSIQCGTKLHEAAKRSGLFQFRSW